MTEEIKITTGKVGGANARYRRWEGYIQYTGMVSNETFCQYVADKANRTPEDITYVLAMVKASLVELLRQGYLVKTDGITYRSVCRGPFSTCDAAFKPDVNKLQVVATPNGKLKDCMKGIVPKNLVKGVTPFIYSILDSVTNRENVLSPGHTIYLAGRTLLTDPARPDEKVWFENRAGTVAATGKIILSRLELMDVTFETWPEPGVYTFCLSTRGGMSEDYAPVIVRKEVTVTAAVEGA